MVVGDGCRVVRRRVGRGRPRAGPAAHRRGARPRSPRTAPSTARASTSQHICDVMEALVREAEGRGVDRREIAPATMFVSHETYTPARGGSAAAEINALRRVFGPAADSDRHHQHQGLHRARHGRRHRGRRRAQGARDRHRAAGPELPGARPRPRLAQPVHGRRSTRCEYALRLAAGFGSQVAMSLLRWTPVPDGRRRAPERARLRLPGRRPGRVAAVARPASPVKTDSRLEVDRRRLRVVDTGAGHHPGRRSGPRRAGCRRPAPRSPPRAGRDRGRRRRTAATARRRAPAPVQPGAAARTGGGAPHAGAVRAHGRRRPAPSSPASSPR